MKKISTLLLLIVFNVLVFSQNKKFFNAGSAELKNDIEEIPIEMVNGFPIMKVEINNKTYNFLFDTGAPTVISEAIYKELDLKPTAESNITDSQNNKQKQVFTYLPEMKVGNAIFKNIGSIVMPIAGPELSCLKLDGILGANQMAKVFWKVNYKVSKARISKSLSQFNLTNFETKIPFKILPQKTPRIETSFFGKTHTLTFDTGFNGRVGIQTYKAMETEIKKIPHIISNGINSVGVFGSGDAEESLVFIAKEMPLGNEIFKNELIKSGKADVLGSEFLKDYEFIMDWKNEKIYLKKLQEAKIDYTFFGFGYRFIDNKTKVILVFKDKNIPLELGDEIISINDVNVENLSPENICQYYFNRIENQNPTTKLKVKRNQQIFEFEIERKNFFE